MENESAAPIAPASSPATCPGCHRLIHGVEPVTASRALQPNDVAICAGCRTVMIWERDWRVAEDRDLPIVQSVLRHLEHIITSMDN